MVLFRCLCYLLLVSLCMAALPTHKMKHVHFLTQMNYNDFIKNSVPNSVYFYHKDDPRIKLFLKEYEKSAERLEPYQVKLSAVDCTAFNVGYCNDKESQNYVHIFRDGNEMVRLELDTMFDVDSIGANILQLVLLKEVPILQTKADRNTMEKECSEAGSNCLFTYVNAMGTDNHLAYLETSFSFTSSYRFGITTEREAVKDLPRFDRNKQSQSWLIHCISVTEEDTSCPIIPYNGKMNVHDFTRYLKVAKGPLFEVFEDDKLKSETLEDLPYDTATLFYCDQTKQEVLEAAKYLALQNFGELAIFAVKKGSLKAKELGFPDDKLTPTLRIQIVDKGDDDGYMIHPFNKENVLKFADDKLLMYKEPEEEKETSTDDEHSAIKEYHDDVDVVLFEDNEVTAAVFKKSIRTKSLNYPLEHLDIKTFYSRIKKDFTLVIFHVSWDSPSLSLIKSLMDSRSHFEINTKPYPVTYLNCFDWTDICEKEGVQVYPTIRIYSNGQWTQYKDHFDGPTILSYVKLQETDCPVALLSIDEVVEFTAGKFPKDLTGCTNYTILGAFDNDKAATGYKNTASANKGEALFGFVSGKLSAEVCMKYGSGVPCIVALHNHDKQQPPILMKGGVTTKTISEFIQQSKIPSFPELTVMNFPTILKKKMPIVIFFGDIITSEKEFNMMKKIVANGAVKNLTYVWMNVFHVDSLGSVILSDYTKISRIPTIAVLDKIKNVLYLYDEKSKFHTDTILDWLNDVSTGKIPPTKPLADKQYSPLHPGFDFLSRENPRLKHEVEVEEDADLDDERLPPPYSEHDDTPVDLGKLINGDLENLKQEKVYQTMDNDMPMKGGRDEL